MGEEIETLYLQDGPERKPKACWFPFKKAYLRRRIEPEHNTMVLPKTTNDSLLIKDEATEEISPPEISYVPYPDQSLKNDFETNSLLSEDDFIQQEYRYQKQLTEINPNCISKDFWVDEMVEGGSLVCAPVFPTEKKAPDPDDDDIQESANTTIPRPSLKNIQIARTPTQNNTRIEVEYDFSQQEKGDDPQIDMSRRMSSTDRFTTTGCSTNGRGGGDGTQHSVAGSKNIASPSPDAGLLNSATVHKNSFRNQSKTEDRPSCLFEEEEFEVIEPPKELSKRMLCGTVPRDVHKPKKERFPLPTELRSLEERLSREPEAHFFGTQPYIEKEGQLNSIVRQKSENEIPQVAETSADTSSETTMDSAKSDDEEDIIKKKNWLADTHYASMFFLRATNCAGPVCRDSPNITDSKEEQTYNFPIEVSATNKQLKEVTDLDEIKAKEAQVFQTVDFARNTSLADDDSSFAGQPCIADGMAEMIRKITPKRSLSLKSQSIPATQRKDADERAYERSVANTLPRRKAVSQTTPRDDLSKCDNLSSSNKGASLQKEDVVKTHAANAMTSASITSKRKDLRNQGMPIDKNSSVLLRPTQPSRLETLQLDRQASMSKNEPSRNLSSIPEAAANQLHQPSSNTASVINLKSQLSTTSKNNKIKGKKLHDLDFELARFPSLSSDDWRNTIIERPVISKASIIDSKAQGPAWAEGLYGEDLENHLDPEAEYIKLGASRRSYGSTFSGNGRRVGSVKTSGGYAGFDYDDDDDSLNTEAFRRLGTENDDDSIFNGIVERSGDRRIRSHGPRISKSRSSADSVSDDSNNALSKYTSYTETSRRGYSVGRSVVSRGDLSVYTEAEGDVFCMDEWL